MDYTQFVNIVGGFLSQDNSTRKSAEEAFNQYKINNPTHTAELVLQLLSSHPEAECRVQAAVLIRNLFRSLIVSRSDSSGGSSGGPGSPGRTGRVGKKDGEGGGSIQNDNHVGSHGGNNRSTGGSGSGGSGSITGSNTSTTSTTSSRISPGSSASEASSSLSSSSAIPHTSAADDVWSALSPQFKNSLKSVLLDCLEKEEEKSVRTNICDSVSDMASRLLEENEWPDLTARLFRMISNSQNFLQQQSAWRILSEIAENIQTQLEADSNTIGRIVHNALSSPWLLVRHECLGFVACVCTMRSKKLWKQFQPSIPNIMESVDLMLNQEPQYANEYLQNIVKICESDSAFWRPHLVAVAEKLLTLAKMQEEDICCIAVEALLSIAENKPKLARQCEPFMPRLVETLLTLMLDIEQEHYSEWLDSKTEESDTEQRKYDIGEAGLDRLAKAFSDLDENGGGLIATVFAMVQQFLKSQNQWHFRFVGIMAISQTVEYLPEDKLEETLDQILAILLQHLKDPDRHVRFAACQAIGQVALDQQPLVQERYHQEVLPALCIAFDDPHPRVRSHAACAFVNYAEEVDIETLRPCADTFMQKLYLMIQEDSPRLIREHAVTAVAVIAGVLDNEFVKYYSQVMPIMKSIISNCVSKEERNLRGKALECISIVGLSVGTETFLKDGQETMGALMYLSTSGLEPDDPVKEYLQEALGRMCKALKEHFVVYLPTVIPPLLQLLQTAPKEIDADDEDDDDDDEDDMTMVMVSEGKCVGLKTSLIEEQEGALDMLASFIEVLGPLYSQWIQPTTQALLPLLSYVLSEDVKQKALQTMGNVIYAARLALKESPVTMTGNIHLDAMISSTANHVFNNLSGDMAVDEMSVEVSGLVTCLDKAGPSALPAPYVKVMCDRSLHFVSESSARREQITQRLEQEGCDEEDVESVNLEIEEEQGLRQALLETLGMLMKHHPDEYIELCSTSTSEFIRKHITSVVADDRALGYYVCCDVLEHLKEKALAIWPQFIREMIQSCNEESVAVRRACAYGVCQACKIPQFGELAESTSQVLLAAYNRPDNRSNRDAKQCTDNVVAALGDIANLFGDRLPNRRECLQAWLNYLPLQEDADEARRVHSDLISLMEKSDPEIIGHDNSNVPKLVGIVAQIYKTELSDSKLDNKILSMIHQLGTDSLIRMEQSLTQKQRDKLEKIFVDMNAAVQAAGDGSVQDGIAKTERVA